MTRIFTLSAAMAALVFTPAAMADNLDKAEAGAAVAKAEDSVAIPAKLVSFDGEEELLRKSSRMRIWRSHIAYKLTVDADGNPVGCELTEKFRSAYVSVQLCKLLIANHTFEPARDANDRPVEGVFTNRISYMDLRAKH
ncbi:hypothetical protein [Erythrobacter sp. JK5]|uniref:hypothetical protein n=1 Tax=Erythrobacter sp. JK5 TaxID=2829500 RepID=UPI001BABEAD3|nr:hypothetical protein [Erythrobacter sp. JK5]QUL38940.1 hypothetical protein KDC96_06205 [Erythrobacter sp. JK5]